VSIKVTLLERDSPEHSKTDKQVDIGISDVNLYYKPKAFKNILDFMKL
jgi:hypothetical protein